MASIMTPAGLGEPGGAARELDGRIAIVTGSTAGLGFGIAAALAARGAAVVLQGGGRMREIEAACRRLARRHDVPVRHDEADLARPDEIACLVERTARAFGPCDILVNGAFLPHAAEVEELAAEAWEEMLAVHLSAAFHAMRAVLPRMRARRQGRIVNIALACGPAGLAAQQGLVGLTRAVAQAAAGQGITCNALCLGPDPAEAADHGAVAATVSALCGAAAGAVTGAAWPVRPGPTTRCSRPGRSASLPA